MRRFRGVASLLVSAFVFAGCASPGSTALAELRERFIAAGGMCTAMTTIEEPYATDAARCAEGATLVVFASTQDRADFIKSELETNADIRARTHIMLSKDTWLVIGTLAVIVTVWPDMGGMISGRNGANP